ncbi:MAG: glycosyltransferase family 2 protein [Planctomycetota bacterium]|jgi:glycosyltransferase involved in cell wall biosynthesis
MYRQRTVSLVIPARDLETTLGSVLEEFRKLPFLDEILVVDNNSRDRTAEVARSLGARVVPEDKSGQGAALITGMSAAKGDVLALTDGDGSFLARDLLKLLLYMDDAEMVVGTRTTRQMADAGANMGFLSRWGNLLMARWLGLLWFTGPRLTDVGCSYRALTRNTFDEIRDELRETGPALSAEMTCATLCHRRRVIEVPVTYRRRRGGGADGLGGLLRQARAGLAMFRTICRKRVAGGLSEKPQPAGARPPEAR